MALGLRLSLLILLASLPVFLIQIVHDIELRKNREDAILNTAETLASLVAARKDRIVEGSRLLLIAASYLQATREKNAEQCNVRLREITEQVPELTAMAVLSPTGERWCFSLTGTGGLNLADREYFQATIRSGTMQTSNFIVGRQTGEGSIVFTYPIRGPTGDIESVVFLAYRTSVLSRMLNEPTLPTGAVVALLGRDGVVAARWPDPANWVGKNLSSSNVIVRAINDRRGKLRGVAEWAGPGEYAFAFAPVNPPTNLTVVLGLPLTAALQEAESIFWREVGWTTLIFALAAVLAMIGAHLMVGRPIRQLSVSVDALAQGDFKSSQSASVRGSKELNSLAVHFMDMAKSLEQRQSQLVEAVKHKELLIKEVNHRVKNSLQLVASLFGLQRANIKDPEARRQFDEAGRRINTVAQIHQRLYQDENVDNVSFDRYLQELCRELNSVMGGAGKISIVCETAPCHLPTDQVIPVALMINELITNAFKYSYPGERDGMIRVECRPERDILIISVADDGIRLSEDFDPASSKGLGMRMITALAKQLRASLEVVQNPTGKSFVIKVPLRKESK